MRTNGVSGPTSRHTPGRTSPARPIASLAALLGSMFLVTGCGEEVTDGPPTFRLGESVCAECGMIISDARFATATIVDGARGPEAHLFDDFNCQINFERSDPGLTITRRWSHDHVMIEWMPTDDAWFLRSPNLRTPMASRMAAFRTEADAKAAQVEFGGEVLAFAPAWANTEFGAATGLDPGLQAGHRSCCPSSDDDEVDAADDAGPSTASAPPSGDDALPTSAPSSNTLGAPDASEDH